MAMAIYFSKMTAIKDELTAVGYGVDTNWYVDSGAFERYNGHDKVHTANGAGESCRCAQERIQEGQGNRASSAQVRPHRSDRATASKCDLEAIDDERTGDPRFGGCESVAVEGVISWRFAYANTWQFEEHPREIVIWAHFIERGLVVPTSNFFRGILEFYGLQLVHLNPNGVLHIAIFVHLCEVYLGIPPHYELFRKLFRCKPQPSAARTEVLGGAGIQLRNSEVYLDYELPDSHGTWKEKWFYIGNHNPALPIVTGHAPKHSNKWIEEPAEDNQELLDLMVRIAELKRAGLSGINVAASFLKRRVQPLKLRENLGYEYIGFEDPSRMSSRDISDDAVVILLAKFFKSFQGVPVVDECISKFDSWYEPER
ncbi:uncharacterized protein [Setaria viridis]|uniref:uncharacterized protein n=1 Tax=Setaria viridis TaxID=4556 RepID=UPI003B3ABF58